MLLRFKTTKMVIRNIKERLERNRTEETKGKIKKSRNTSYGYRTTNIPKRIQLHQRILTINSNTNPKLLIKDHKDPNDNGSYPTRLIVPATNFTAAFPKLGYLRIKNIFDTTGINYKWKTIMQASSLKAKLEKMES